MPRLLMTTQPRQRQRCRSDGSGQTCLPCLRKQKLGRHRFSWNDIEGRQVRAAAPRTAQGTNGRREASGRRRKSISRAKTAGARRPIGGERSISNILVSLDPRTDTATPSTTAMGWRPRNGVHRARQEGRASTTVQMTVPLKYR